MKIDGKALADKVLDEVEKDVWLFHTVKKRVPSIVVLQVGDNPASNIYVRNKRKACDECNISCEVQHLPARKSESVTSYTTEDMRTEMTDTQIAFLIFAGMAILIMLGVLL